MAKFSNEPARSDLVHRQASTQDFQLFFQLADGTPVDITGKSYTLNVRKNVNHGTILATYTMGTGLTIVDGPNGVLGVVLDDVASPLPKGDWVFDMDETTGGLVVPVLAGSFCVPGDL